MNELPPDPHLQAALRHAPDAQAEAPPEVTARVFDQARRAVARPPAPPWWQRWWRGAGSGWMPQGALASLLLAGLITLLWRDERPGPAVEQPVPMAAQPAPAAAEAAPPAVAAVQDQDSHAAAAQRAEQAAAQKAARQGAQQAERQAQTARDAASQRAARAAAPATSPAAVPTPVPVPAPPPSPPAPPAAPQVPAADAPVATASPAPGAAPSPAAAAAFNRMALSAQPPMPWGEPPGPADRLLRPATAGEPQTIDPAWLAALARSIAAPWQDAAPTPPAGEPLFAWERQGAPHGRLWIERREARNWLVWCAAGPAETRCQQAPLRGEAPALPR